MLAHLILGLVQGLTEFLPISSSGHLVLAQELFGFSQVDPAFNVFVQGGTVLSVLLFFRNRLKSLTKPYLKLILIASLPAALAGILLSGFIDSLFSSLWGASLGFALTTIVVSFSRIPRHTEGKMLNAKSALLIGLSQAVAILPGFSRSGSTITTSLRLGISSVEAFNFSFLLSIPVIAGASLLSLRSLTWDSSLSTSYLLGFIAAALTGYWSLVMLAKLVSRGRFYLFAPYTAFLTLLSLYLVLS